MANLSQSVADIVRDQVTLQLACLDRMYLNVYIPKLQYPSGAVGFLKDQRSARRPFVMLSAFRERVTFLVSRFWFLVGCPTGSGALRPVKLPLAASGSVSQAAGDEKPETRNQKRPIGRGLQQPHSLKGIIHCK